MYHFPKFGFAITVLGMVLMIAYVAWKPSRPAPLHAEENNAISGMLLVSDVVQPVLAAAYDSDAFAPESLDQVAREILPEDMPPPPRPPLPAGLASKHR